MRKKKKMTEAEWTAAFVNDLPDSSFALVLPGGEKDADGKTTPRDLRKLPYQDAEGQVDLPHLRNALARISQVEGASAEALDAAQAELQRVADEYLGQEEQDEPETPETPAVPEMDSLTAAIDLLRAALDALTALQAPETPAEPEMTDAEPEMAAAEFAESAAPVVTLVEQEAAQNPRAPLDMRVALIKAGPGNARDRHYYTREMLERDGHIFEGLPMHVVDHNESQRAERTDVSTVLKVNGVQELDGGEYLTATVRAYDPDFCEKVRNRAAAGLLGQLQCSILATGEAEAGEVDGEQYNVVTAITEGRFVDWVTRAGAGGHALQLAELAAEPEAANPAEEPVAEAAPEGHPVLIQEQAEQEVIQPLASAVILATLGETNLPAKSVAGLARADYRDSAELQAAITAEVARLKAAGSGQPLGMASAPLPRVKSLQEIQREQILVNQKYLGGR